MHLKSKDRIQHKSIFVNTICRKVLLTNHIIPVILDLQSGLQKKPQAIGHLPLVCTELFTFAKQRSIIMAKLSRRQFLKCSTAFGAVGFAAHTHLIPSASALSFDPDTSLSGAEYLSADEVLRIADQHIAGSISSEIEGAAELIHPSSSFINVYDTHNSVFAYLVPLCRESDDEIGYIMVGALRDGFSFYEICLDKEKFDLIKKYLGEAPSAGGSSVQFVYVPPFTQLLKTNALINPSYYSLSFSDSDGNLRDVTEEVAAHQADIDESYAVIRSEEHRQQIRALLASDSLLSTAGLAAEEAELFNWERGFFVPVYDDDFNTYYGGNQEWFSNSIKRNGCGPVAAANITYYLADSQGYTALYPYSTISKANFMKHIENLYNFMDVPAWGLIPYSDFGEKVEQYASSKNVFLSYYSMPMHGYSQEACEDFIINGLTFNSPVAALNASAPIGSNLPYNWHWITITKLFRTSVETTITLSTGGQLSELNFAVYYSYADDTTWSGLLYFV